MGEIRCQTVTGLERSIGASTPPKGKVSMPQPPLADGLSYQDLVVTKGVVVAGNGFDQELQSYMARQASNLGDAGYLSLTLLLMDENGAPIRTWSFRSVIIQKWKVSGVDAQKSGFAVDEITFKYKEFSLF